MTGKLTRKMVLRLTPEVADYLQEVADQGGYRNTAELLRATIAAIMQDDLDYRGNGSGGEVKGDLAAADGLAIDMGSTRPPWGD